METTTTTTTTEPQERTFTASEIREATMTYSQGCAEGKAEFLSDCFGIDANPTQEFTILVRIKCDTYNRDADQIVQSDVESAVERTLDYNLPDELECETVDART